MKKLIAFSLIAFVLFSCEELEFRLNKNAYWGCWVEATGKPGVYDLKLAGEGLHFYSATLGHDCGDKIVVFLEAGVFRNDTLFLDNGQHEFRCYLQGDTLLYSSNANAAIEKLIKI